jgi:hypothetical protein
MKPFPLVLAIIGISAASLAQGPADKPSPLNAIDTFSSLTGTCEKLMIAGKEATARCKGQVINTAYKNGRSNFVFTDGEEQIVSFLGEDHPAKGNEAVLTLTNVTVTRLEEKPTPVSIKVRGTCTYTNPYSGPSRINCAAKGGGKRYGATFVSDGKPPQISRF